jgi:hypothetical protein
MSQDTAPSTALERRAPDDRPMPLAPVNDAELATMFRTARALAESGLFKDATQASQAFAKMLAGRDLGLTPFESMSGLHVIEGKIEASSDLHATKVREAPGMDFRVAWIKLDGPPEAAGEPPKVSAVWMNEEDPADLRETYGCAVVFYDGVPEGGTWRDGQQRAVSTFTHADAVRAGLDQPSRNGKPSNHVRYPRNMFYARAMTNGVAWYVPEVMGGLRVYGHGEIPGDTGEDLTAGDPRTTSTAQAAKSLPTEVEALIARARELGHAGLANRDAWAVRVGGDPAHLATAIKSATVELNRMAAGKEPVPTTEPEPEDAIVVPETAADADTHGDADATVLAQARQAMADRLEELEDRIARAAEDPGVTSDDTADMEAEAEHLRAQLGAQADPNQQELGL